MGSNDLVLVQQLVSQRRKDLAPELSESDYFNIFVAEMALIDRDLSYNEIQNGIVDGGGDGGIDAIYLFINNTLCRETIEPTDYKRNVPIELVFIQSKTSPGFSEEAMNKFSSSSRDLLDLSVGTTGLSKVYNADLLERINIFQQCFLALTSKLPKLSISYYYATYAAEIHPNVQRKVEQLREIINTAFNPVKFSFDFLTAGKLLLRARSVPQSTHSLRFTETPISTGQNAYVCLVTLPDYYAFISENGVLNERIFESNVRDYQGNVEVNKQIRDTLFNNSTDDFWWLNNGITVLCTSAMVIGKTLTIENAEVVNGLQTSREIFNVLSTMPNNSEQRSILVRVIEIKDIECRDRIITATNSQTSIPIASLRATDKIHRDIEDYLMSRGLFYDRRKNYYKNQGKPLNKIVSIGFLAQAVLACVLGDPANARARPSSLIKLDEDYNRIFNENYPLDVYYNAAALTLLIEDVLRSDECDIPRQDWNNIVFYVAMVVSMILMNSITPSAKKMLQVVLNRIKREAILECAKFVRGKYQELGGTDQVAKGTQLKADILEVLKKSIPS